MPLSFGLKVRLHRMRRTASGRSNQNVTSLTITLAKGRNRSRSWQAVATLDLNKIVADWLV